MGTAANMEKPIHTQAHSLPFSARCPKFVSAQMCTDMPLVYSHLPSTFKIIFLNTGHYTIQKSIFYYMFLKFFKN